MFCGHRSVILLQWDEYRAIVLHKARNAYVPMLFHLCKSRMVVSKCDEFLQTASLLADVYEFIFRIIFIQLLDLCAVRAAFITYTFVIIILLYVFLIPFWFLHISLGTSLLSVVHSRWSNRSLESIGKADEFSIKLGELICNYAFGDVSEPHLSIFT